MSENTEKRGFLGREHYKTRFDDLSECFFGRLLLLKSPNPQDTSIFECSFSLLDVYPQARSLEALTEQLLEQQVTTSNRVSELAADLLSMLSGTSVNPSDALTPALDFYNKYIKKTLGWLKNGDETGLLSCIIDYDIDESTQLHTYRVRFVPRELSNSLAQSIRSMLDLTRSLSNKIEHKTSTGILRVDFRKQLDFLIQFLDKHHAVTGGLDFSFHSSDFSFRHIVEDYGDSLQIPMPGTTVPSDKILLPLFLEINGDLDIRGMSVSSSPLNVTDIQVRYGIRRPSATNAFHVEAQGLTPGSRGKLNQHELQAYLRVYKRLASRFIFGGKPRLERSFGDLSSWVIRKLAYCLEEPTFLKHKAIEWLEQHGGDSYRQFEDNFFLPFLYDRLREEFGGRIVKKPERFGGEIDLLFDDDIPVELKVREGQEHPLADAAVDSRYPGTGQAATYAAVARLGIVIVLDLPRTNAVVTNLDNCVSVVERPFLDGDLPTCIAAFTFHCHHPRPSSVK